MNFGKEHKKRSCPNLQMLGQERTFFRSAPDSAAFSAEGMTLEEITRHIIEQALAANKGNQSETARRLGISRSTLWRVLGSSSRKTP